MRAALLPLALAAACLPACERAPGEPPAKPLSAAETDLLAQIPGGNHALFGGSYTKGFQKLFQDSPFARFVEQGVGQGNPGMKAWMDCFLAYPDVAMAGGLRVEGRTLTMRFALRGLTVQDIATCATRAAFPVAVDPDGAFVALELPAGPGGATMKAGYLAGPKGTLYFRQAIPIGGPVPASTDRAQLEADVASLAQGTATGDQALMAELARVDRSKAVWFAGSGAGTPIAAQLGGVRGWFDVDGGLAIDVSVQVKDAKMADQAEKGIGQAKQQSTALPPALGAVIEKLRFERSGDRLRVALALTNSELEALFAAMGPMLPRP